MAEPSFEQREKQNRLLLKFSYWYVTNKVLLRRILIGVIAGIAAIFWLYALWGILDAYVLSYSRTKAMFEELVSNQVRTQQWIDMNAPRPIGIETARVFSSDGNYHFLARITNSSPLYWARFDYRFTFSGGQTELRQGYILPSEEKWLGFFGHEASSRPSGARLTIENIDWERIDIAEIGNYDQWRDERMNIVISDIEHLTDLVFEEGVVAKTRFLAQNLSAYGYYRTDFYVVAYRGATPTAVNFVSIDNFRSGDSRTVEVSWFDTLPQISKIEVEPQVNLFEEDNYL